MERTLLQLKKRAAVTDGTLTMLGNGSESRWLWQGTGLAVEAAAAAPLAFQVGEFAYSVTPAAFIQSNLFLLETMQRLLTEYLQPRRFASAADLFCGAGFFTLPLSRFCRSVQALENDPPNLLSLRANLKANRAENVSVLERDLYRSEIPGAEIYVLDPPRQGITKSVIDQVAAHRPRSVVCFACDSATFARDLALFLKMGFTLSRLQLLDNFPQTDHLEIFAVLERG